MQEHMKNKTVCQGNLTLNNFFYRILFMTDILIATHNKNKLKEFKVLLEPLGCHVLSADDVNLPDVEETGTTFRENSAQKALAAAAFANMVAIADDSGLCVHALNNEPGLYSARYAAANGGYPAVFEVLFNRLTDVTAHLSVVCVWLARMKRPCFLRAGFWGD